MFYNDRPKPILGMKNWNITAINTKLLSPQKTLFFSDDRIDLLSNFLQPTSSTLPLSYSTTFLHLIY